MTGEKEAIYRELLVLRCQRGERSALEELIELWEMRLFYYVRRLVDDEQDAWDILQQVWLKVLKGIRSLREPRGLRNWLYRIARDTTMSHWRKEYADAAPLDGSEDPADAEAGAEEQRFMDAEQVHYGLHAIPLPYREVLTLHFLEDFPVNEMAEILGIPPGTVKSRLYHARRALRAVLEKENRDDG